MKKIVFMYLLIWVGSVNATVIEVSNSDSGWYDSTGRHISINGNYIAGNLSGRTYHNFFVFDISGVSDTVTSATLKLFTHKVTASATYNLFDVTTPISSLVTGGLGLVSTYNDLGNGSSYGSLDLLSSQDRQFVQINLNSNAISAINLAGGLFAIGGTYSPNNRSQYAFGNSYFNPNNKLILNTAATSVPEPAGLALSSLGLLASIGFSRRKKVALLP